MTFRQYSQKYPTENNVVAGQLSELQVIATENLDTPASYEQSRRRVSSVVVAEEVLGERPQHDKITYVEVPVIEEVVKYVPETTVIEVEKIVPKVEVEYIEEIVEVPQIEYIDHPVEKIIQHEPGTKLIEEVQKEVIKHVAKGGYRPIEKIVEVPGDIIEVPVIKRNASIECTDGPTDAEVPVVVAQTIRPVLTEVYDQENTVDVYAYKPKKVYVDVFVPKPVQSQLFPVGAINEEYKGVNIPPAQFNTLLKQMNQHLPEEDVPYLPFQIDPEYNKITFLHPVHTPGIVHNPELEYMPLSEEHNLNAVQYTSNLNDSADEFCPQSSLGSIQLNSTQYPEEQTSHNTYSDQGTQKAPVNYDKSSTPSAPTHETQPPTAVRLMSKVSNYDQNYYRTEDPNYNHQNPNEPGYCTGNQHTTYAADEQPGYMIAKTTDMNTARRYNTQNSIDFQDNSDLFQQEATANMNFFTATKPNRSNLVKRLSCGC